MSRARLAGAMASAAGDIALRSSAMVDREGAQRCDHTLFWRRDKRVTLEIWGRCDVAVVARWLAKQANG
jgi:hypothetical protein